MTTSLPRAELLRRRLAAEATAADRGIPRRGAGDPPLSPAQRALWLADQMSPGGSEYLMPLLVRAGGVGEDVLCAAVDAVVARHEVLRTRYGVRDGEPVQLVDPPGPVPRVVLDLRSAPGGAEAALAAEVAAAAARPIDLAAEWPLRALVARVSDDETVLLLTVHHIASDGGSEDVLVSDLDAAVTALAAGALAPPSRRAAQYGDYAVWREREYGGARTETALAYWTRRLAGTAEQLLPIDRPRGAIRGTEAAAVEFSVPADVVAALTAAGRAHGATPFMVLLAAFQVLLGRYGDQTDVVVGSPVSLRDHEDLEHAVGMFTGMVALRADLSGNPAFTDLLAATRESTLDAYSHQHAPFDRVVSAVVPERDASRSPLFQTVFQLAPGGPPAARTVRVEPVGWRAARYDLDLTLAPRPDGSLAGSLEYATALFDAGTAHRITGHYRTLLRALAACPSARLRDLPVLTDGERAEIDGWSLARSAHPVSGTLTAAFERQVAATPDARAATFDGSALSYAELNARANRLAHRLRAEGAGPGDLVGVRMARGLDLVVALLGVLKSGAGYLPLDPGQPAERLAFIAADAGVRLLVSDQGTAELPGVTVLSAAQDGGSARDLPATASADDTAYVIYTSGSTGKPKGVPVSHRNVLRLMASSAGEFGFDSSDVWTLFHSYAFDFSVWELWGALLHGGRIVVVPQATARTPARFLDLLAHEGVTVLNQTPSAFRGLVEAIADDGAPPLRLRTVIFGGEALDPADLAPWFARFPDDAPRLVNMYGITETTVHVTTRRVYAHEAVAGAQSLIGRALPDLRLHVLDNNLDPVPVGVPGQLYVGGPGVAGGYLGRPALTADRFGPDPGGGPGERMFRTGDLARRTRDGDLVFLGRADDQVKVRGHRIEPGEVESALLACPGVTACAVVACVPAGERSTILVAYVVGGADPVDLRARLGRALPAYMVPARFVSVARIPLTANGKTDRSALPGLPAAEVAGGVRATPRTPVEQVMTEAWAEALGVPAVGVHDNFFAMGGDSIRAIRVVGALRRRGVDITVQDLLVHQTVDGLSRLHTTDRAEHAEERRVAPFALLSARDRETLPDGLTDAYPVAMVQAAMVYQMLADPDSSPYHNVTLFPIEDDAPFSLPALRAAAQVLARRHDILRTAFALTGFSEPLQLVRVEAEVEVGYLDLRALSTEDAGAAVDEFTRRARSTPFAPARAPLLAFHALRTGDAQWVFAFVECHAILDGWSHNSLINELMDTYRALRDGRTPTEPAAGPVPARFADFVAAERRAIADPDEAAFWADRIARFDRVELPPAWAAPDESPSRRVVPFADLEPGLRALATAAGASLKSVLFAAHVKVLGIATGMRSFHTGLVANGRLETAGGELVRGMHLNTLPVGVTATAATWTDLVRSVFAEEVAVWPHRRFPLPEMQRRWGGGVPLVDTAFTYLDFHVLDTSRIDEGGIVDVSPNEFALDVWTFPGRLFLATRPDKMGPDGAARLAGLYRRVLERMAADPLGDAGEVPLDPAETTRVEAAAHGPAVAVEPVCAHELFQRQARRTPDAVAVECDGAPTTYAELDARANRVAHRLQREGVGPEALVGVLLRRGPDLLATVLGVLKAGGAYLPLEPAHPDARLRALLADAGACLVVTDTELAARVDGGPPVLALDVADLDVEQATAPESGASPASLAYVVFTSGSTGTPKGVLVEHRNLVNYVTWCLRAYTPLGGSGSPLYSSLAFDLPVTSVFPALLSGQTVTITHDDGGPGLDALVTTLRDGGFGLFKSTPSHLAVLNRLLDGDDVRRMAGRLVAGGEELTRDMLSTWVEHAPDTVVDNEYGPTETTVGCSYLEGRAADLADGVLPIGRPIDNTTMRVLDLDLRPVPEGVVGELYIGGAQVTRGYLGQPALTADKFVPDPHTPGARLYRSGDLARLRPDGVLEFAGRVDNQVKVRGYRVEPGEVEAALRRAADLSDAVVRVRSGPGGDKALVAYVVPAPGSSVELGALSDRLAAALPAHLVPSALVSLDALPLTRNGKVDEAALAATAAPASSARYVPAHTALENILVRAWEAVLGRTRVGVHDRFAELGGHSLEVMRVIARVREEHGVRLRFRDFYTAGTIAGLARLVESPDSDEDLSDTVVWLRRSGDAPPLFCTHPSSAHFFAALADRLGPDRPVAALEWPGLTRWAPAPRSVEHVAELNVAEIRKIAPTGPYHLLGWCGGSQITTEMARILSARGERVTFMLLDPALDTNERDNIAEFMRLFRRAEAVLAELADAPPERVPELQQEVVDILPRVGYVGSFDPPVPGDDFWPLRFRVWRELLQNRVDYRHRPYPGRLELLVGDELAAGQHDVAFGQSYEEYAGRWSDLADGVRAHRVPGSHLGVLREPDVAEVAAVVAKLMAETEERA